MYGVSLPEWSKGLRSGRNVFERVGSNPTADIFTDTSASSSTLGGNLFCYFHKAKRVLFLFANVCILFRSWLIGDRVSFGSNCRIYMDEIVPNMVKTMLP